MKLQIDKHTIDVACYSLDDLRNLLDELEDAAETVRIIRGDMASREEDDETSGEG